jgi:dihydropteroate synthase
MKENYPPRDADTYRISQHALRISIDPERGFAKTEEEARERILEVVRDPAIAYRSNLHPDQWKFHARDGRMVVIVDVVRKSIPTAFVSGHLKKGQTE